MAALKGIASAVLFFIFGVVAGIAALTTPIYEGSTYFYSPNMNFYGEPNLRVMPFARICISQGYGCVSFSDASLTSTQAATFVAYSVLVIIFIVIAVVGIVASVLEQCGRRINRVHLMVLFIVDGVFAFAAWVMMVANRSNNPYQYNSGNWSSLSLGPSPGIMIAAWIGNGVGIAVAAFVKGRETEGYAEANGNGYTSVQQGYDHFVVNGVPQQAPRALTTSPYASRSGDIDVSPAPAGYVWTTTTTTVSTTVTRQLVPVPSPSAVTPTPAPTVEV